MWNGCVKGSALATHELVYTATGNFNPYVCSELFFRTNIELALNNFKLKFGFSEKNYFDMLCLKEPMPHTIIRNVNGVDNAKNIPGVVEITFVKHVGDTVTEIGSSTDRIGFVIAEKLGAEFVCATGRKLVFYRRSSSPKVEHIEF